jgi:hypothetical protein
MKVAGGLNAREHTLHEISQGKTGGGIAAVPGPVKRAFA